MKRFVWYLAAVLGCAGVYFGFGKFGLSLALVNASASAVWPSTGIALAAILLWGYRLWPGIFLGACLVNITTQGTLPTILGIASGNTLEAVLGAWLVNRFAHGLRAFDRAQSIFKFVLLAPILSTMVSATFGVTSLCLGGAASWDDYDAIWITWWLGDLVGSLIFAPLVVIWCTQPGPRFSRQRLVEAAGLLATVILVGQIVFFGENPFEDKNAPLGYLTLLPLLWAAFRFQQRGAVTSAFLSSALALWATLQGSGPFVKPDPNQSLLIVQVFIGTLSLTALVLAAVVSESKRAEQRLQIEHAISRVLAESLSLAEAIAKSIRVLCETGGWDGGAVWQADREANELSCLHAWQGPSVASQDFVSTTWKCTFKPGIGLPGRVWSSGQAMSCSDMTCDPTDPRAVAAMKTGLYSGVCFPIKCGDHILGVAECFSRQPRAPDDAFLIMLGEIGRQLGQFMERRRAEEALRQSEERLRLVLDNALDAVVTIDRQGCITDWNPQAEVTFGWTRQEALGRTLAETIIPESSRQAHDHGLRHFVESGVGPMLNKRIEITALRRDRSEFPAEMAITPVSIQDGIYFSAFLRDISERRKFEAALEQARAELKAHAEHLEIVVEERTYELRETIAELESFSYSISHDMRAPLRAMQGYASILEQELKGKITDEQLEFLGRIIAASSRLSQLVRDILGYSKISRANLHLEPVALQPLILELIQQNANLQPPRAEVQIEGELPVVLGQEAALIQVWANLLGNAVKFVSPECIPRVRIWAEEENDYARIWIADQGIGIEPKNHERIFHMFERVNSPQDYEGTGIGLAIVRKAMERMEGQIGVKSELGSGSKFWLKLARVSGG